MQAGRSWTPYVLAVTLFAAVAPLADGADACASPADFAPVPELGLACANEHGWLVLLDDGTMLQTHGPDPLPPPASEEENLTLAGFGPEIQPFCVANPANQHHMQVIYSRPSNKPDRFAQVEPELRAMVREVNGYLRREGVEVADVWANYKVACTAQGDIDVKNAVLATPAASDSFGSIVSNLRAQGFTSGFAKYWIWHDDTGEAAGVANLFLDDRGNAQNANNNGAMYAVTFAQSAAVMMHENGHNLGAVQTTSPFSSRLGHCNDDNDIMCYLERVGTTTAPLCQDHAHFDCNHNDYFHPNPSADNYLATRWNIGARYNRFVAFSDAAGLPDAPANAAWTSGDDGTTLTWDAPANTGSGPVTEYRIYRSETPGAADLLAALPATATNFTDAASGATYHYRISAANAQGEGNPSVELRVVTARPPLPPQAPSATPGPALGQVTLRWLAPLSDEGAPVTNYRIHREPLGDPRHLPPFLVEAGPGTTFVDAPPNLGAWHYRVSAVNSAGESFLSSPAFTIGGGLG